MRDIRSDLEERANVINGQIRAAYDQFERGVQQLQCEVDARVAELKSALDMITKFMAFENRQMGDVSSAVPNSPLVTLADRFMHVLNDVGHMSREQLIELSVKEGFFPDAQTATQEIHPMLISMSRSELIRELPDGNFAPPTMSQAIKLRRVV